MLLLYHSSFTFVSTIKQDLINGLTQMINLQQKTEVQELAHIIISNYITLCSLLIAYLCHDTDGMTYLTQFDHNINKPF